MNLVELTQYTNDEERAEAYFREQGILKTFEECPHCGGKRINRVRDSNTSVTPVNANEESGVGISSRG